jgi:transposase
MRESADLIGDRLVSRLDLTLDPKAAAGRRVEVITGGGGRRRWSEGEKERALEASREPGAVVSAVARQHGVTPQQLFTWRREARRKAEEGSSLADGFVPVVVEAKAAAGSSSAQPTSPPPPIRPHSIELDVEGSSVFIWPGAEPGMVRTIIGALKGAK